MMVMMVMMINQSPLSWREVPRLQGHTVMGISSSEDRMIVARITPITQLEELV